MQNNIFIGQNSSGYIYIRANKKENEGMKACIKTAEKKKKKMEYCRDVKETVRK
jgi:hypothetical protein